MKIRLLLLVLAMGLAALAFRLPAAIQQSKLRACGRKLNGDALALAMLFPEHRSVQVPHDANRLKSLVSLETVTPMAISKVDVSSGDRTSNAVLRLLELTQETTLRLGLRQLEPPGPSNRPQIAIGRLLAAQLGVNNGAFIQIATRPIDGSRGSVVECFVRDIIDLGCDNYNAAVVVADLSTSSIFGLSPDSIAVWFKSQSDLPNNMDELSRELGITYELQPLDKIASVIQ